MAKNPKTKRKPGFLVRLIAHKAPEWFAPIARDLDAMLHKIWMALDNSLPGRHGAAHRGGSDSIAGSGAVQPVAVGGTAQRGDPHLGFSPHNHVHNMDPATLQEGSVDPKAIEGNPRPPFRTLKEQTDWLNAQGSRLYAVNPILKATWR